MHLRAREALAVVGGLSLCNMATPSLGSTMMALDSGAVGQSVDDGAGRWF